HRWSEVAAVSHQPGRGAVRLLDPSRKHRPSPARRRASLRQTHRATESAGRDASDQRRRVDRRSDREEVCCLMRCAVVGAGAWGTALADLLSGNGHETVLWALEPDVAASINECHENRRFLAGLPLVASLRATND